VSKSEAASLKFGVSGWQEESRGESMLSMVMETGLGKDEEVVWAGLTVSGEPRRESRSATGAAVGSKENSTPPGYFSR
jgi:hypothetical protein